MAQAVLVGCGFLGSIFFEEVLKRNFAGHIGVNRWMLIDGDKYEERNAANQQVTLDQARMEMDKVAVLKEKAYGYGIEPECVNRYLKEDGKAVELFSYVGASLIVDALDNLEARHLVWRAAATLGIPVLHMGASQRGTGSVEWTHLPEVEQWHLTPMKPTELKDQPIEDLPPCELVGMRGLGLNVAIAAAKAYGIYHNFDPEKELAPRGSTTGAMTAWTATNNGHQLLYTQR